MDLFPGRHRGQPDPGPHGRDRDLEKLVCQLRADHLRPHTAPRVRSFLQNSLPHSHHDLPEQFRVMKETLLKAGTLDEWSKAAIERENKQKIPGPDPILAQIYAGFCNANFFDPGLPCNF